MPVAGATTLHALTSCSQVGSSLTIRPTAKCLPSFANYFRHFSDTKNSRFKLADRHRSLDEGHQGLHTQNEAGQADRSKIIQVEESRDDEEHGAMSRQLKQLAETYAMKGSAGRLSVNKLLDHQNSVDDEARCVKHETISTATSPCSKVKGNIYMSDKVSAAARAAVNAKAKSAAFTAERAKQDGSLSSASSGSRLANARVRSAQYASAKATMDNLMSSMTPTEREAYRTELRARFQFPSGHSSGNVTSNNAGGSSNIVTGLASLANERIDAAIAAGAFQKISRGTSVHIERDHNASSPFIDTTEYLMNRMVQRQDIVPPWIEKQQEIATTAGRFRARLRADWRRHAVRTVASEGGTLEEQMEKASLYALAEAKSNPQPVRGQRSDKPIQQKEQANKLASHVTVSDEYMTDPNIHASSMSSDTLINGHGSTLVSRQSEGKSMPGSTNAVSDESLPSSGSNHENEQNVNLDRQQVLPEPFRDPAWEAAERSYHDLQIHALNSLTRTYNLQAPDIAKKPYFSLDRELRACYAEVAPQLSDDIRMRALAPKAKAKTGMAIGNAIARHRNGNIIERIGGGTVPVREDTRPKYGFKELWKDFVAGLKR